MAKKKKSNEPAAEKPEEVAELDEETLGGVAGGAVYFSTSGASTVIGFSSGCVTPYTTPTPTAYPNMQTTEPEDTTAVKKTVTTTTVTTDTTYEISLGDGSLTGS
jgi:hypothetical protein